MTGFERCPLFTALPTDQETYSVMSELAGLVAFVPGEVSPIEKIRPLGPLSDLAAEDLGMWDNAVTEGAADETDLYDEIERCAASVDDHVVDYPDTELAQTARVDLAFIDRLGHVASEEAAPYRRWREFTRFFEIAQRLGQSQEQYPLLQWSDIAEYHPVRDPRTFLSPGAGRDQEVFLYKAQSAIDRAFRQIVRAWGSDGGPTLDDCRWIAGLLDLVVEAMANLSRRRELGEFDKLDRFLTDNGEVRGHATGSFSAYTQLAGWLTTGRDDYLDRLADPVNRGAFDRTAREWIDRIVAGDLTALPFSGIVDEIPVNDVDWIAHIDKRYTDFHRVHRGAVRKHAKGALGCPAPARPTMTNAESIDRCIDRPMTRRW